ncbi:MAG: pyridoxal phosphate-dependent aminotransferase [Eubacterium sp.]|nr:pyridoxal phosphate-dependent aminotransferase [Eubacterium sp.]
MSKYNFDKIVDRAGTNSLKWDIRDGELPMWVADMDFETAPEITEAIINRASSGIFGYSTIPDEWSESYIDWWKKRHLYTLEKDWLIFCTGVVPAISSIVRKLTTPAEKVLVFTPVYNIFFNSIINNGRVPVECPLIYVENEEFALDHNGVSDGHFEINWELFEKQASDPQVSMLIFCNPQNPTGTIWYRKTLCRVGEICAKYGITVVSDEIHCDLICPMGRYIPFASVSEVNRDISITCIAPSKTFNIAGLCSAAVSVPNPKLRHKVWRALNTDEIAEPNVFAVQAAIAAYKYGADWLDELRIYVGDNKNLVHRYIEDNIPELKYVSGLATYLCWIDARKLLDYSEKRGINLARLIRQETGLWITDGAAYGEAGRGYLRMNVACPRSYVEDGLDRLKRGIKRSGRV